MNNPKRHWEVGGIDTIAFKLMAGWLIARADAQKDLGLIHFGLLWSRVVPSSY